MNAVNATEAEAFDLLVAGVTLAPVFQDAPEDTPPPVVILGDLTAVPFTGDPNDEDKRITLTVLAVTEADERVPCLAIQDEVEASLTGHRVDRDGWALAFRLTGSDAALSEDGSGYVGTCTFEIIAFSLA